MPFFLYASFPNSRNRNRAPTRVASTYVLPLPSDGTAVKVVDADQNRTSLTLENTSEEDDMVYTYATEGTLDPTVDPVFGLQYDVYYNTDTQQFFQKQDEGLNTNWNPVNLEDVGFLIRAVQSLDIQSLQVVYAKNIGGANDIALNVDLGRG